MVFHPLHMNGYLMLVFYCLTSTQAYRCSVCSAGKYKAGIDNSLCLDCAENTYSATLGATACVPCGTHSSAPRGSSACACEPGFAKTGESMDCSGCSNGLVFLNGKCECPAGSSGPSSGPCALCAAGKFTAAVGSALCADCPMHTYQAQTGATNCIACPGALRAAAGSTSPGMCECGVGFLQRADACEELLPRFVEVRFEIQTTVDAPNQNQTQSVIETQPVIAEAIKEAVLLAWISEYNVSREYLVVEVVAIVEPGRRLLATTIRYMITVRRIFPADTSVAFVDAVVLSVANFSAADVEVLVPASGDINGTANVTKLEITGTAVSVQAIVGLLNLKLNAVVTCELITWHDTAGATSQVCDKECGMGQGKIAAAFVDGQYILGCVDRRVETSVVQTTPVPSTPAPTPAPASAPGITDLALMVTFISVGASVVLLALICKLRRKKT